VTPSSGVTRDQEDLIMSETPDNPHTPVAPEEDASTEQPGVEAVEGASTGEGESAYVDGSV
jgi:hypothetical protein